MATLQSRILRLIALVAACSLLAGCEVKFGPSNFWDRWFTPETDTEYYQEKSEDLVDAITRDVAEYEINKVVVLDLVDDKDKVPILGQYLANRVVEAMTRNKTFRVAQRGEVLATLERLDLKPSFKYTSEEIQRIGKAMNAQACYGNGCRRRSTAGRRADKPAAAAGSTRPSRRPIGPARNGGPSPAAICQPSDGHQRDTPAGIGCAVRRRPGRSPRCPHAPPAGGEPRHPPCPGPLPAG